MLKLKFQEAKVHDVKHETIVSKEGKEWEKITIILYAAEFVETQSGGFEKEFYVPITFFGFNASRAENVDAGDIVNIDAELGGRFWEKDGEKKYFPEVNGFNCYIKHKYNAKQQAEDLPKQSAQDEAEDLPF